MVTAPICTYSSNNITRAQSRAGEWNASYDFDVESITTATLLNIASTNESLADSSRSLCNSTGAFCRNHQYSITAITTSTGAISERYAYTAYGQPTILDGSGSVLSSSAINNRYTYTGREWDATLGLHHFRARWMSPSAGRFLGRDPIGYVDGFNIYRSNLSLHRMDPSGLKCCLRTWNTDGGSLGSHSALKCDNGYYSMYPQGPHTEQDDGLGFSEVCLDCLDENAIASKWNEIKLIPWNEQPNNCSWFTWQLITAGVEKNFDDVCRGKAKNCWCFETPICKNNCREGTGFLFHPEGTKKYLDCILTSGCKPYSFRCEFRIVFTPV
jgi:RHS repeat-associated protein